MIPRSPLRAALWSLVLTAVWLGVAQAQPPATPAAATPAAEVEEKPPPVVAIGDVAGASDTLAARLAEIDSQLDTADLSAEVAARLESLDEDIERAQARLEVIFSRQLRSGDVTGAAANWERLDGRLSDFKTSLGELATDLDGWLSELGEADELWKRSRASARQAKAPPAVMERIDGNRKSLAATKRAVEKTRNTVLDLQAKVGERRKAVNDAREQIERAQRELSGRLRTAQTPPLWASEVSRDTVQHNLERVGQDMANLTHTLADYAVEHHVRMILHLLLAIGLSLLFAHARENLDEAQGDPAQAETALRALAMPRVAGVFFALFLTPYLHPERTPGFSLVVYLAALPLWWLVVRGLLDKSLHAPALAIVLLSLAEILRIALSGLELLSRLATLCEAVIGFVGILWLRRPARIQRLPELLGGLPWFRALNMWMRLCLALFAAAFLAELFGYTALSDVLILVPIWGSLSGGALVAMVRIAEAVFRSLIDAGSLDALHMVKSRRQTFLSVVRRLFRVLGFAAWVYILLLATQLLPPFREAVAGLLSADLAMGPLGLSVGNILAFVLTLWIAWLISRFVAFTLDQEIFSRVDMPTGVPFALATFARYTVLVLGFLAAVAMLGFSMDKMTLMVSALGVGIGFGLQNVVNNFVSGILLLFERPVRVGDMVELPQLFGVVEHIGIRASTVRTFSGSDVIVPNGDFISARVVNWTLSDRKRRIDLPVRASFGTDPERVIEVLSRVEREHPDVIDDPEPQVLFTGFGESALEFEIRAWTEGVVPSVRSSLAVAVNRGLLDAGIATPYTQREVTVRMETPPGSDQP